MEPNAETVVLIKSFEGCELRSYLDKIAKPPVWTVGYGLTSGALPGITVSRGMEISQSQADAYLAETLRLFGQKILPLMKRRPTPNQYGAMLSLAYNIGTGAFARSTCLKRFNAGDIEGAAEALTWFNKAGGKVVRGLVRRREAERDLFLAAPAPPETGRERPDPEKTVIGSTTIGATVVTALSGAGGVATTIGALDGTAQIVLIVFAAVAAVGLAWIMRERIKKLANGV